MVYSDPPEPGSTEKNGEPVLPDQQYQPSYAGEPEPVYAPEPPPPTPRRFRYEKPLSEPMRLVFGDMAGAFFFVFIPVLIAFFFPWKSILGNIVLFSDLTLADLVFAAVIAIFPWIVLILHLVKGRIWDGILDMLLWAIWECFIMIILCYLYPVRAESVIWHALAYWEDMSQWLYYGEGTEGNVSAWLPVHLKHLGIIHVGAFLLGLPALILGTMQLNYMNFYVAKILLASSNPLLTLPIAWHFWSVIRVIGYITIATAMFQLFMRLIFKVPGRWMHFWLAWISGILLVVLDGLLKWRFAETVRELLRYMCDF